MSAYDDVVTVLVEVAHVLDEQIEPDSRLDELGLDSLALLEVGLALRNECDVEIDDSAVAQAQTVMDLVELVARVSA
jgi:acyl carrier protein